MPPENGNAPSGWGRADGGDEQERASFQLRLFPSLAPSDKPQCRCLSCTSPARAWEWCLLLLELAIDYRDADALRSLPKAVEHALQVQQREQAA